MKNKVAFTALKLQSLKQDWTDVNFFGKYIFDYLEFSLVKKLQN